MGVVLPSGHTGSTIAENMSCFFFFFPFPELFYRAGLLTTKENCSCCIIFPSCLSRDTVTLFTRLQSRWLFDYFQKSNSPTRAEDNKDHPQSSFGIPDTMLNIHHEFSHWQFCEILGWPESPFGFFHNILRNFWANPIVAMSFSFLYINKLRYKIVKKLAWSHTAIKSRKSETQTWQEDQIWDSRILMNFLLMSY